MNPREAEQTMPRLALVTAYEALEHAGCVRGRGIFARMVGKFYGQAGDDYRRVNSGQGMSTYFTLGDAEPLPLVASITSSSSGVQISASIRLTHLA